MTQTPTLSIVIACFNEEQALPACVAGVEKYIASKRGEPIEVVLVDDGSTDGTWPAIQRLAAGRPSWRALRFMTNRGSHIALRCAYRHTTGARVVNLPVDLQDPIENIDRLAQMMSEERVDAVLAVRRSRDDGWWAETTSRLYNTAMHLVNLRKVPLEGTSQFLLARRVVDQINAHSDHGFTFEGFLASAPLRLAILWYDRLPAAGRTSRWTLPRKVQHALNTILSFSDVPIRALSMTGACVAIGGLLYAAFNLVRFTFIGPSVSGWPSLMTAVLVMGGLNLLALGLLGEYVWRILDESRRRPLYQIEDTLGLAPDEVVAAVTDGSRAHQ
jgi:dolichol-phosphate mannosyltransferase